jgi:N-formylmaleamate deformylase
MNRATMSANPPSTFCVRVKGTGAPMILLPELSVSGDVWDGIVSHFKDHYQCHVVELAGFAGQPPVEATPLLASIRDELAAYIRKRRLRRAVVIGHGLGGFIAMCLAADYPELVHRLVIIDSYPFYMGAGLNPKATLQDGKKAGQAAFATYNSPPDPDFERKAEMAKKILVSRPEHAARIVLWRRASDRSTAGKALRELLSSDVREQLARITAGILVVGTWIGKYRLSGTTREDIERLFTSQYVWAKDWKLVLLDNARHFAMLDDPDGLSAVMRDFLTGTGAGGSRAVCGLDESWGGPAPEIPMVGTV